MTRLEIRAFLTRLSLLTLFVGGLWLAFQAREILGALLMAGFTAILVSPILEFLERKKIPSALAITFLCFFVLFLLFLVGIIVFPLLSEQIVRLESVLKNSMKSVSFLAENPDTLKNYPIFTYLEGIGISIDSIWIADFLKNSFSTFVSQVSKIITTGSTSILSWIFGVFGAFSNIILSLVFFIFILLERRELFKSLISFLPKKVASDIHIKVPMIQTTLSTWWRGQAILCLSIGGMTLLVLFFLGYILGIHIEHYFSLALIAGICEFIPIIGPLIALIPAVLIGLQGGWIDVTVLVIAYISIQQIESLFLVPRVQGSALSLSHVEVLIWMTISGSLFGVLGVLFTLPVLAVSKILLSDKKLF